MNQAALIDLLAGLAAATLHEAQALRVQQSAAKALILARLTETFPELLTEFQRLHKEAHEPPEAESIVIGDEEDTSP